MLRDKQKDQLAATCGVVSTHTDLAKQIPGGSAQRSPYHVGFRLSVKPLQSTCLVTLSFSQSRGLVIRTLTTQQSSIIDTHAGERPQGDEPCGLETTLSNTTLSPTFVVRI